MMIFQKICLVVLDRLAGLIHSQIYQSRKAHGFRFEILSSLIELLEVCLKTQHLFNVSFVELIQQFFSQSF